MEDWKKPRPPFVERPVISEGFGGGAQIIVYGSAREDADERARADKTRRQLDKILGKAKP